MEERRRIVVLTGAGVSADSGISTFRDNGGLWAKYRIEDVCTPEALARNRAQVIEFYNIRRRELLAARPNAGHAALSALELSYKVQIITQNIDDLHERAGSTRVLHLHGELRKLRSSHDENLVVPIEGWEQDPAATAPDGSLLRPFVVFFGESVPMYDTACRIVPTADVLVIAGTSLAVYPAAALAGYARPEVPVIVIDPGDPDISSIRNPVKVIKKRFTVGMAEAAEYIDALFDPGRKA
ncbi:MAG: NAD-dependent deacylase [Alistipes sp.]|nr:NAD-dependent deacylase [Alistipes sp.]